MSDAYDGPRYLVSFGPKRVPHCFTDILILGGGLAGLRAALAVDPRLSVTVVTKDDLRSSSSQWAQGGIAGVVDPEDRSVTVYCPGRGNLMLTEKDTLDGEAVLPGFSCRVADLFP